MHWNIEEAFGILHFGYCPIKVLPSGESSWSALPWFLRLLGGTPTHKQMLGRAQRVAKVGKAGIWIPRILQQREYQGAAEEAV